MVETVSCHLSHQKVDEVVVAVLQRVKKRKRLQAAACFLSVEYKLSPFYCKVMHSKNHNVLQCLQTA